MSAIASGTGSVRVALAIVFALAACGSGDGDSAASTEFVTTATAASDDGDATDPADAAAPAGDASADRPATTAVDPNAVLPEGFDLGLARVTKPDGTTCDICVWRAISGDQRSTGLMGVTDLGPADGMTFEYDQARNGWFWMKGTVLPLSIAFFGRDGVLVDSFDMEPCTADPCERYQPEGMYTLAIEVRQGGLADLGITAGSRLEPLGLPCDDV